MPLNSLALVSAKVDPGYLAAKGTGSRAQGGSANARADIGMLARLALLWGPSVRRILRS